MTEYGQWEYRSYSRERGDSPWGPIFWVQRVKKTRWFGFVRESVEVIPLPEKPPYAHGEQVARALNGEDIEQAGYCKGLDAGGTKKKR